MGASPEVERRRVTLSDVARQAGVSIATASFVLSGRDGQPAGSPATRSRVQQAAADLGYRPNQHARAIRTGRTGAVALALGDTRDPWMGELAHQVSVRAQTVGLSTVVLADESWFEFLQGHQFDCAFVTGADFTRATREMVAELGRQGSRLVVFSELSPADDFDVISSQMTPAVAKAYGQLRSRHDRVHFMATDTVAVDPPMRTRQELFSDAAVATGDDPGDLVLRVPGTMSEARKEASAWLADPSRPTAIIAQTGYLAVATQVAALHVGIRVPDDLEIISIGDVPGPTSLITPVSYYGADDVFDRIARAVVHRAGADETEPFTRTELEWTFHPGGTTR